MINKLNNIRYPIMGLIVCVMAGGVRLYAETHVSGTIEGQQVWTAMGSPYIVDASLVVDGVLDVEPNAVVVMTAEFPDVCYLTVRGEMNAQQATFQMSRGQITYSQGFSFPFPSPDSEGTMNFCTFTGSGWLNIYSSLVNVINSDIEALTVSSSANIEYCQLSYVTVSGDSAVLHNNQISGTITVGIASIHDNVFNGPIPYNLSVANSWNLIRDNVHLNQDPMAYINGTVADSQTIRILDDDIDTFFLSDSITVPLGTSLVVDPNVTLTIPATMGYQQCGYIRSISVYGYFYASHATFNMQNEGSCRPKIWYHAGSSGQIRYCDMPGGGDINIASDIVVTGCDAPDCDVYVAYSANARVQHENVLQNVYVGHEANVHLTGNVMRAVKYYSTGNDTLIMGNLMTSSIPFNLSMGVSDWPHFADNEFEYADPMIGIFDEQIESRTLEPIENISIYTLTDHVTVSADANLALEPGLTILIHTGSMTVYGGLQAIDCDFILDVPQPSLAGFSCSTDSQSVIRNCSFSGMGGLRYYRTHSAELSNCNIACTGLMSFDCDPNILYNTITGYIACIGIGSANIIGNTFTTAGNMIDLWENTTESPLIQYNNFNPAGTGVINDSENGVIADARYNWWGSSDGPGPVGLGSGAGVDDNVLYDPWLTSRRGDFNTDNAVNLMDFGIIALAWQNTPDDPDWNPLCDLDLPPDQHINIEDLAELLNLWLD